VGQIYLRVEGQPDELFTQGAQGSKAAPWIGARKSYNFLLYVGTNREKLLALVTVTQSAS